MLLLIVYGHYEPGSKLVQSMIHNFTAFHSWANSLLGANRPIGPWPIHSLELSLPGPLGEGVVPPPQKIFFAALEKWKGRMGWC